MSDRDFAWIASYTLPYRRLFQLDYCCSLIIRPPKTGHTWTFLVDRTGPRNLWRSNDHERWRNGRSTLYKMRRQIWWFQMAFRWLCVESTNFKQMPKVLQLLSPTALLLPFLEGTSNIHDFTNRLFPILQRYSRMVAREIRYQNLKNTTQKAVTIHNVTFVYQRLPSSESLFFFLFQAHLNEPSTLLLIGKGWYEIS